MKRSIEMRLAAMFALAALVVFTLVGAVLYGVLERELDRHQMADLRTNLQSMRYSIERTADLDRWARVCAKMDTLSPPDGQVRFWVLGDDPRYRYGHDMATIERFRVRSIGNGRIALQPGGRVYRVLAERIAPFGDRPAVWLAAGIDVAPFNHTSDAFLSALVIVGLVGVMVVTLLGGWIARLGLRPLQQLSREARALQPRTFSQRLRVAHLPVELSDLSEAFNGALGRLEDAYRQLEAFNADVAHELRTPLANLIGGTQVALSRPRGAAEFQEVLQSNLEELERLRSIINDMLFLARADQGEAATGLSRERVAEQVGKTIEFFEFVLDERDAQVTIEGQIDVQAAMNTALFRRALSNLLQNAIEHSATGARLVVRIEPEANAVWILVANPGAPIAAEALPRLFDRFYRVDASRHDSGDHHGHGLGLAIVKAVAAMHGGGVSAHSEAGTTAIGFSVAAANLSTLPANAKVPAAGPDRSDKPR